MRIFDLEITLVTLVSVYDNHITLNYLAMHRVDQSPAELPLQLTPSALTVLSHYCLPDVYSENHPTLHLWNNVSTDMVFHRSAEPSTSALAMHRPVNQSMELRRDARPRPTTNILHYCLPDIYSGNHPARFLRNIVSPNGSVAQNMRSNAFWLHLVKLLMSVKLTDTFVNPGMLLL